MGFHWEAGPLFNSARVLGWDWRYPCIKNSAWPCSGPRALRASIHPVREPVRPGCVRAGTWLLGDCPGPADAPAPLHPAGCHPGPGVEVGVGRRTGLSWLGGLVYDSCARLSVVGVRYDGGDSRADRPALSGGLDLARPNPARRGAPCLRSERLLYATCVC